MSPGRAGWVTGLLRQWAWLGAHHHRDCCLPWPWTLPTDFGDTGGAKKGTSQDTAPSTRYQPCSPEGGVSFWLSVTYTKVLCQHLTAAENTRGKILQYHNLKISRFPHPGVSLWTSQGSEEVWSLLPSHQARPHQQHSSRTALSQTENLQFGFN